MNKRSHNPIHDPMHDPMNAWDTLSLSSPSSSNLATLFQRVQRSKFGRARGTVDRMKSRWMSSAVSDVHPPATLFGDADLSKDEVGNIKPALNVGYDGENAISGCQLTG